MRPSLATLTDLVAAVRQAADARTGWPDTAELVADQRPGQTTRIHDHITWCVVGVLSGIEHEELFDEALNPIGTRDNPPGEVSGFAPPGDIHRIRNEHAHAPPNPRPARKEIIMNGTNQRGPHPGRGTIQRMDNVAIVVDDLAAATAFFAELGLELEGEATVEGSAVDRLVALEGVRSDIAMMRTPDGHGRVELTKYHTPSSRDGDPRAPANTLGAHRIMFAVDDIDDILDRLRPHGAELLGELVQYENSYRLCYLRGPAGIIVALAEQTK